MYYYVVPNWRTQGLLQQNSAQSLPRPKMNLLIKGWLKQRQELLVLYSQLCETNRLDPQKLELFCQTLMDYISAGHFKVFEKVAESYPDYQQKGLDPNLLEQISSTTDFSLDFNEKYTEPTGFESLLQDLSELGEHLAHRMDWEDKILGPYLKTFQ